MILDQNGNTFIITQEKATIVELVKKIEALYPKFEKYNIVIKLSSLGTINLQDIIEFLRLSNKHRASKQSFVIVTSVVNTNEMPDEIVVVPTLQEAFDIVEMEEMERDLGI